MLNVFERLLESGEGPRFIDAQTHCAQISIVGRSREGLSRLNDLRAVKDLLVDFVGKLLNNAEGQTDNFSVLLGIVLWAVADVILPGIVEDKIELRVLGFHG